MSRGALTNTNEPVWGTFITIAAEKMMPDHIIISITGIRDSKTLKKYKKVNKDSIMESAFNVFD